MPSCSSLTVDLRAIHHNLNQLSASFSNVMVMVKANAYGTDPLFLSQYLQTYHANQVPFLGVSHVAEGVKLRESGIVHPIFVISAPPYEAELAVAYHLTPAVSSFSEVKALAEAAKKQRRCVPVHLHLNTGMNRFGISPEESHFLYQTICKSDHLRLEGIMTHFAAAEYPEFDTFTERQITLFSDFLKTLPTLPRWIHAANSGGAVRCNLPFCNLVRIGLGVVGYGICLEGTRPALSLKTKLASVSLSRKGESVGYNRTFRIIKENARIGVIAVGYHDGFQRSLSGKGYVLIRGKKASMIGLVCMDFMMIDLTEIPEAEVGDEVLLFGRELSVEQIAGWAGTDVREILVNLPTRIERNWIYPAAPLFQSKTGIENKIEGLLQAESERSLA